VGAAVPHIAAAAAADGDGIADGMAAALDTVDEEEEGGQSPK